MALEDVWVRIKTVAIMYARVSVVLTRTPRILIVTQVTVKGSFSNRF